MTGTDSGDSAGGRNGFDAAMRRDEQRDRRNGFNFVVHRNLLSRVLVVDVNRLRQRQRQEERVRLEECAEGFLSRKSNMGQ
jgi:hypothetical protein